MITGGDHTEFVVFAYVLTGLILLALSLWVWRGWLKSRADFARLWGKTDA